jgi:Dolichyl-phosphate-mannose-protein mannosyltransferase
VSSRWSGAFWGLLVIATVVVGTSLRAWYMIHRPLSSDEAVVGLMAAQMVHGHFRAFYWGQWYGGTAEPFLIAAVFRLIGQSALVVTGVPAVLYGVAAILTWRIARRLVEDPRVAALAGTLVWIGPQQDVANSAYEFGFRGATLVCSLVTLLLALRIHDGVRPWAEFAVLGLAFGVGWWSSPEVVYLALPAGVLIGQVALRDVRRGRARQVTGRLSVSLAGAAIGALPWEWSNIATGLKSLDRSQFRVPPGSPGYLDRLETVPTFVLPILFSLRSSTGAWLGGSGVGITLSVALAMALIASLALCLARGGRAVAIAIAVVAFPFLMAYSPATFYWNDGRYGIYAVPLIALVLALGCSEAGQRLKGQTRWPLSSGRLKSAEIFGVLFAVFVATSLANFYDFMIAAYPTDHPDAVVVQDIHELEGDGVHAGFAEYWVAYKLDFLSQGGMIVAGTNPDRYREYNHQVERSPTVAWIFVDPTNVTRRLFSDSSFIQGPNGVSEARFTSFLISHHIHYRVFDAGILDAVIPVQHITPR